MFHKVDNCFFGKCGMMENKRMLKRLDIKLTVEEYEELQNRWIVWVYTSKQII